MEVAGLVVGTVVLIKPLCDAITDTLSNYRGFGKDAERLRLRFAVQTARLESFERVLFETDKFTPAMPGKLIDHLPEKVCNDILSLLRQLYGLLFEYAAVRSRYKVQENVEPIDDVAGLDTEDRINALTTAGHKIDAVQQSSVGWARKMLWATFHKSGAEKLVSDFEVWTERTQQLLEAAWWPLSFFETVDRMKQLETDEDAKSVGLLRGIGLRKLIASPPALISSQSHVTEIVAHNLQQVLKFERFEICQLQCAGEQYLVEYKHYEPVPGQRSGPDTIIRERVVQLAAMLHDAPGSDPTLSILGCRHYFEDTSRLRFGLVYALPDAEPGHELSPRPLTLADVLEAKYPGPRPSLCSRIRLAQRLVACLGRLHAYSWVHKSLRPDNVMLFQPAMGSKDPSLAAVTTRSVFSLEIPRLVGFEYSRQESDFSDQFGELEITRNIYRHPTRWGKPTKRFDKVHDIYALGVLLLEIGLWSRADQLDNGALIAKNMADDPAAVQKRLLKHAQARLGFYAGNSFRDIVVGCLSGDVGSNTLSEVAERLGQASVGLETSNTSSSG